MFRVRNLVNTTYYYHYYYYLYYYYDTHMHVHVHVAEREWYVKALHAHIDRGLRPGIKSSLALLRRMEARSFGCEGQLVDLRSVPCEMHPENIFHFYDKRRFGYSLCLSGAARQGEHPTRDFR